MSIISDTPITSVQGAQLTAALALSKILEHDELPRASWTVHEDGSLTGQIHLPNNDDKAHAAVLEYAQFLGREAVEEPSSSRRYITVAAEATYQDAPVRVWTHVSSKKAEAHA